jgi:hypothetical protein
VEELVDWAVQQLQGAGACARRAVRVDNFTSQVVAGALHQFDLELEQAGCPGRGPEACTMVVWEQVWAVRREVSWAQTICARD